MAMYMYKCKIYKKEVFKSNTTTKIYLNGNNLFAMLETTLPMCHSHLRLLWTRMYTNFNLASAWIISSSLF